jgi:hypothetical protein
MKRNLKIALCLLFLSLTTLIHQWGTTPSQPRNKIKTVSIIDSSNSISNSIASQSSKYVKKTFTPPYSWSVNKSNKLTYTQTYRLELSILKRLTESYASYASKPASERDGTCYDGPHTPTLIEYDDKLKSFSTSYGGESADTRSGVLQFCELSREDVTRQSHCIQKELDGAMVTHNDIYPKNIVIDSAGKITLIDYDIATIDGKGSNQFLHDYYVQGRKSNVIKELNTFYEHLCVTKGWRNFDDVADTDARTAHADFER